MQMQDVFEAVQIRELRLLRREVEEIDRSIAEICELMLGRMLYHDRVCANADRRELRDRRMVLTTRIAELEKLLEEKR